MRENMEVAGLAHRRYPDMDLLLAIDCFHSDRRRAGLGALDQGLRKGRGEVRNHKCMEDWAVDARILYVLTIDRPARKRWPKLPLPKMGAFDMRATITLEEVPAVDKRLCLPVTRDMLA